jgi:hypothetical protein
MVVDSAGIRIVTSVFDSLVVSDWSPSPDPLLDLGVVSGDSAQEFQFVAAALRTSRGEILIANAGSSELRGFSADGRFLRATGRSGDGPGEFRNLSRIWRYAGDSVIAFDAGLRRVTVFDSELRFGRIVSLASPRRGLMPALAGVLRDGTLVVNAISPVSPDAPGGALGVHRSIYGVYLYSPDGQPRDSVTTTPGDEWVGVEDGGAIMLAGRPFYRDGFVVAEGNAMIVADGDVYDLRVYTGARLRKRFRSLSSPRAVTARDISRYTELFLARFPEGAGRLEAERRVSRTPFPETFAALAGLRADVDGYLWIEMTRAPDEVQPRFEVLDSAGVPRATATMPARFTVMDIGRDYILGRVLDSLNVEHVRMLSLQRSERRPSR